MNLWELEALESFALLGPGFGGTDPFVLLTPLRPAGEEAAPLLLVAPYESRGRDARLFSAPVRPLRDLRFGLSPPAVTPHLEASEHARSVAIIREAIAAGDVYQVNLTLRARLPGLTGAELFALLCARGLPRFAAWVRTPDAGEFLSASPELFFEIAGGKIHAEPMKGTARRRGDLEVSEKDAAELAMITDLMRNDLTPVCRPRSVRVACERRVLTLPYAVQTVSDVEGTLLPGLSLLEVLDALHPGGSITGAPKLPAMEMIARLETSPRGFYCGALGYAREGRATVSLLIRTASRAGREWVYGAGGGIVYDSNSADELDEIRVKLGALGILPEAARVAGEEGRLRPL